MAKKILRAIDRWRFEAPLAVMLGVAAGFAVAAMPSAIFAAVPVAGAFGLFGQGAVAAAVALLSGIVGYALMRAPGKPKAAADEDHSDEAESIEMPAEVASDRLRRVRRADRHPDAPPRVPIHASRDLGEPLMEVGLFFQADEESPRQDVILDGEFIELPGEAAPAPHAAEARAEETEIETLVAEEAAEVTPVEEVAPVVTAAAATPPVGPPPPPRPERQSLTAMIDRLSAGLERRAAARGIVPVGEAPRDMRPALREALEELNRLAAGRA